MFPFRKALKQSKHTSAILLCHYVLLISSYGADTEDQLPSIKSTQQWTTSSIATAI